MAMSKEQFAKWLHDNFYDQTLEYHFRKSDAEQARIIRAAGELGFILPEPETLIHVEIP